MAFTACEAELRAAADHVSGHHANTKRPADDWDPWPAAHVLRLVAPVRPVGLIAVQHPTVADVLRPKGFAALQQQREAAHVADGVDVGLAGL